MARGGPVPRGIRASPDNGIREKTIAGRPCLTVAHGDAGAIKGVPLPPRDQIIALRKRRANRAGLENERKFSEIRRFQEVGVFSGSRIDIAGGFMDPIPRGIERL